MECPRTGKNGGPARPAAGPSRQQGSRSMCALGPCSSESRAGQDAQWRGGALPVNSSCSMPTATVLPSSILVVATCREDLHQRGHQGEVLVLGVLGGRRRGVGHAHVVAAGGRCVSCGYPAGWCPVPGVRYAHRSRWCPWLDPSAGSFDAGPGGLSRQRRRAAERPPGGVTPVFALTGRAGGHARRIWVPTLCGC